MREINLRLSLIEAKLDIIGLKIDNLTRRSIAMAAELDALEQQVAQNTDLEQSAIVLIQQLADMISQVKTDPARLQKLSDDLKAKATALAAAITANTPPPPPAPAAMKRP